jgi:hypothetical protein
MRVERVKEAALLERPQHHHVDLRGAAGRRERRSVGEDVGLDGRRLVGGAAAGLGRILLADGGLAEAGGTEPASSRSFAGWLAAMQARLDAERHER